MAAVQGPKEFNFSCEKTAYWFFRLNGFLTLTNFLVHHERRGREGTEIDVLGVRLPHRMELALSGQPMDDYELFTRRDSKIDIAIADATIGRCKVNSSWVEPKKMNMERVLFALGIFPRKHVEAISIKLYSELNYEDGTFRVNIYALGEEKNTDLPKAIQQVTWEEVLLFIHDRFVTFEDYKTQHVQWDSKGKALYELARLTRNDQHRFLETVTKNMIS